MTTCGLTDKLKESFIARSMGERWQSNSWNKVEYYVPSEGE